MTSSLPKCFAAIALLQPDEAALLSRPGDLTDAVAVGRMLQHVHGLDAHAAAVTLLERGFSLFSVARALGEVFARRGLHIAAILGDLGIPAGEIAGVLRRSCLLPARATASALLIGGASVEALTRALATVYELEPDEVRELLAEQGFANEPIEAAVQTVFAVPRSFLLAA